jgi:hypothetical protein
VPTRRGIHVEILKAYIEIRDKMLVVCDFRLQLLQLKGNAGDP